MRKVIRLTENELINLVKKIIREDEDQWVADSQEMEDETDFSKMEVPQEIANDRHFRRLVRFFENNPDLADELEQELEGNLNEDYEYKDFIDLAGNIDNVTVPPNTKILIETIDNKTYVVLGDKIPLTGLKNFLQRIN